MAVGQGFKSYMQFAREATYGTDLAATIRIGFIECEVTPRIGSIRSRTLNNSQSRTAIYQGGLGFEFRILMHLTYQGLNLLLDGVMGTATFGSNGGTTTGIGPYVHTFIERALLNSYTIEIIEGDIGVGLCQALHGAKITSMVVRGTAGQEDGAVCSVEFSGVAQTYTVGETPTAALTAVTELPVLFSEATTVDDGTADTFVASNATNVMLKEFELTLRNPVADRRYMFGLLNILEPLRNDFIECTIKVVKEYQTTTMLAAVNAFTAGSPKLVFGSTTSKRLTLDMGTANITQYNVPIRGYGILEQTATWEAVKDTANASALKILVENTQPLITTP